MITLTDWKDTVQRVGRDMVAVLPVKLSLRQFHRCMEQSSWDNLHGPLPGALSPVLGCNPKRSSNRSPDGDIPYSPLYSKLQCYHLHAWLGAVALTVLFGELSCRKSLVSPGCAKLSVSIAATAARWPSMAPYRGASGLAIRIYSIPWPPASPGALPTRCTIEGAPLLAFAVNATILDALCRQSHT